MSTTGFYEDLPFAFPTYNMSATLQDIPHFKATKTASPAIMGARKTTILSAVMIAGHALEYSAKSHGINSIVGVLTRCILGAIIGRRSLCRLLCHPLCSRLLR
jgi:hypothetical protein